ncbi:MAG: hypothetical protein IT210_05285 [Armatimonadetes bacterium]|nr:hypothetical protein [Armatimonadota bacterium]
MSLGNMTVGMVIETGNAVARYRAGGRVFGHFPIRETHTVAEGRIEAVAPEGMSPHASVCWDPAKFALGAVRDAHIRLGERVAVFGMGAIGLIALQMARLSGAAWVQGRPGCGDRGQRGLSRPPGSGSLLRGRGPGRSPGLLRRRSLRPAPGRRVAHKPRHRPFLPCLHGAGPGLSLMGQPPGPRDRLQPAAGGTPPGGRHIDPIVPFEASADAYRAIDERPWKSVQLGVVYG